MQNSGSKITTQNTVKAYEWIPRDLNYVLKVKSTLN